jgi:hypothetical protein
MSSFDLPIISRSGVVAIAKTESFEPAMAKSI